MRNSCLSIQNQQEARDRMNWFNFLKQDMREQLEQETRVVDSEKLRQERQARMAQEQAEAAKPQPVAQPSVPSQLPARARRALGVAGQGISAANQARKTASENFAQAYLPTTTARRNKPSESEQATMQSYEDWFKQTMDEDRLRQNRGEDRILDYRDTMSRNPTQRRLRGVGGFLSNLTGQTAPKIPFTNRTITGQMADVPRRRGGQAIAASENYKLYQQELARQQAESQKYAPAQESESNEVTPLDEEGEINPDFKEEQQSTLDENQMTLDDFPSKEPELPQASRDVLQNTTGTLSDYGMTFTEGSEESEAAKAAREAKQKSEEKKAKKPKGKQTQLGRDVEGQFLPGYGGKKNVAAVTNLERTKNVRQDLADKRKRQQESMSGEQGTLDV